jgi:hypothetical protein
MTPREETWLRSFSIAIYHTCSKRLKLLMNGETPPKTTEAERFDGAMRRALERYDRLSGPGARLHDYVPLKTLEREECIYAIRDALAQR